MGDDKVLILGAGMAGLAAAWELSQHGWPVDVLEARDRVGGRVCTIQGTSGLPVELGAEFIHGAHVVTWELLKRAGLSTHEVPERHWVAQSGGLVENDSVGEYLEKATELIEALPTDHSFQEFLQDNRRFSASAQWLLREYAEGFHAADARLLSAKSFAQAERTADKEGAGQFRINEGYGRLMEWLVSELTRRGVSLHLNTPAELVTWERGAVQVRSAGGKTFKGTHLIVTLPVSVLKAPSRAGLEFDPPLTAKQAALDGFEMGHVRKLTLRFSEQFWPIANFGFVHSSDRWLPTWWADERGLLLTGWAGGPKARPAGAEDGSHLQAKAVDTLSKLFGVPERDISRRLVESHHHDWSGDRFSLGAYSYLRVGAIDAPKQLAEPFERTLFFAGEATADPGELGTVHGALQSGHRAARECLGL